MWDSGLVRRITSQAYTGDPARRRPSRLNLSYEEVTCLLIQDIPQIILFTECLLLLHSLTDWLRQGNPYQAELACLHQSGLFSMLWSILHAYAFERSGRWATPTHKVCRKFYSFGIWCSLMLILEGGPAWAPDEVMHWLIWRLSLVIEWSGKESTIDCIVTACLLV